MFLGFLPLCFGVNPVVTVAVTIIGTFCGLGVDLLSPGRPEHEPPPAERVGDRTCTYCGEVFAAERYECPMCGTRVPQVD